MKKNLKTSNRKMDQESKHAGAEKRTSILEAAKAGNDRLNYRWKLLEEQQEASARLMYDLEQAMDAMEEDHNVKTISMKYTHKCLLVQAKEENDPRTADTRFKIRERARMERGFPEIKPGILLELRRRIRALASTSTGIDMDSFFDKIGRVHGQELTDEDVRQVLRRTLRISPKFISDPQVQSLCAMIDTNGSGTMNVSELKEFIDQEHVMRNVDSFNISKTISARNKRQEEETCVRPPIDTLPYLKPSQVASLKKRIRSAASLAARDRGLVSASAREALTALFIQYDKDGTGELEDLETRKAIRVGLKIPKQALSDSEMWTLIHSIDIDQSGCIVVEEF